MPQIPVYNSNRNIAANPVAPQQTGAEQPYIDQQKIISTVGDITQKWSDAQDVMQYTDAKAKYGVATTDIHARAIADPDFLNAPKYKAELEKAKKESLKSISNISVRNKLSMEFDYDNKITGIKIDSDANGKAMVNNEYQVATYISEQQLKKATASENERAQIDHNIDLNLNMQVSTGLMTQAQADKIKYSSEKDAATNLIYTNPSFGAKAVNEGYFGALTSEDRGKLVNEARMIEKKNKEYADWQLDQTQTQGVIELSEAMQNKTLTPSMVRNMQQTGTIDAETAAIFDSIAIDKTYEIPGSTSLAEPDYFLRLLDDSKGDKAQVKKVMADAAKAYGDHKIGTMQFLYFVQNSKETFERHSKGIFTESKEQQNFVSAVNGLVSFSEKYVPAGIAVSAVKKTAAKLIDRFFGRFKKGDDPQVVQKQIINEKIVEDHPEVATFPEEGKIKVDKFGNKIRLFADGHYEEIE